MAKITQNIAIILSGEVFVVARCGCWRVTQSIQIEVVTESVHWPRHIVMHPNSSVVGTFCSVPCPIDNGSQRKSECTSAGPSLIEHNAAHALARIPAFRCRPWRVQVAESYTEAVVNHMHTQSSSDWYAVASQQHCGQAKRRSQHMRRGLAGS